jgi:hypothetical protein
MSYFRTKELWEVENAYLPDELLGDGGQSAGDGLAGADQARHAALTHLLLATLQIQPVAVFSYRGEKVSGWYEGGEEGGG